jgi:hypothetical protein
MMGASANHMVTAAASENRGVKRGADIDFEAFSDAKRRKTNEKGGKGNYSVARFFLFQTYQNVKSIPNDY